MVSETEQNRERLRCPLCYEEKHLLLRHLEKEHGIDLKTGLEMFPDQEIASPSLLRIYHGHGKKLRKKRKLSIRFGPVSVPIHWDVPISETLPFPKHYRFPTLGQLKEVAEDISISLHAKRSVFIWGPSGSGKDAIIHAFSALTKTPAEVFPVRPDTNIKEWFYLRGFDRDKTLWEEGRLLKICRDGFVTEDGVRLPYLVLITDFDRAGKIQAEGVRLLTDTIQGRIKGPGGETIPVLSGTMFVFTANTCGTGDPSGRYVSANPIDASIMDRIGRKFLFSWMEWGDEEVVLKNKFPRMVELHEEAFEILRSCTERLRQAIDNDELFGNFSHRELCSWLEHAQDLSQVFPRMRTKELLSRAARCWVDGMADKENRLAAERVIDPFTGALDYLEGPDRKDTETMEELLTRMQP